MDEQHTHAVAVPTPQFVAAPDLHGFKALALEIEATTATLAVTSEVERGVAAEWLARGKEAVKNAETQRREMLKPLERDVGLINETFKMVMAPIGRSVDVLARKIGEWTETERLRVLRENQEAERKRREAEAEAVRLKAEAERLEAEAAKLKAEAEAAPQPETLEQFYEVHDAESGTTTRVETVTTAAADAKVQAGLAALAAVPQPMQAAPARTVETSRGTIGTSTVWSWEAVPGEEHLVPRQFLTLDQGKITRAVKGGMRKIPGIRIYPKGTAGLRAGS